MNGPVSAPTNWVQRWAGRGLAGWSLLLAATARALDTNKIPDLKPPLTELPPTWWELNLWSVIGTALVIFAVSMALVRLCFRPRLTHEASPEVMARAALAKLRAAPDDAATAAEVGRQLSRFTQAVLALPSGELTTDETLRAAASRPTPLPAPLQEKLGALLRECDARRFAPTPPAGASGLGGRALELAAELESFARPAASAGNPPKA